MSVPRLRFPGFGGEWEEKRLEALVSSVTSGRSSHSETGSFPVHGSTGQIGWSATFEYEGPAILIARVGANAGKLNHVEGRYGVTDNTLVLPVNDTADQRFIFDFLTHANLNRFVFGSGQPLITGGMLKRLKGRFPTLTEQKKIAGFLGVVDAKIAALRARVLGLETYKRGLMQALFSQSLRFTKPDGTAFPDWEEKRLGEVFSERSERGNATAELLSVTLSRGVVRAAEVDREDGASANRSNYKTVHVGDIAYNSMRMWQGANGVSRHFGIVSPAYTVITPRRGQNPDFWGFCFKLTASIRVFQRNSQGLTSDTWNLKFPALSSIRMMVPHPDEQARIAKALLAMDAKIAAVQASVDKMQEFKKGLLQKMFV